MYRRTSASQSDLLTNFELHLGASKREKLHDPNAWHNVFFEHLVSKIDEDRFAPLFHESRGRPNAPIRVLLGMIFLKDGFGWSDAELFDACDFNIVVMRALGLTNLDEEVPAPSTYYLLKQQLFEYETEHGIDLVGQTYDELTQGQATRFGVCADFIRMDSKLFGSNIANCCRLQLVVGYLRSFWKSLTQSQRERASCLDRDLLDTLLKKQPHHFVYRLKETEKTTKLQELGVLISRLLDVYDASDSDRRGPLERVFGEQYNVVSKKILLKPSKEVDASSLQSVHDDDAAFSNKPGQKVKGYKANITETCNPEGLNLVTEVKVDKATKSDTSFVVSAIEKTESVIGEVKEASMDGAYHSPDNTKYATKNGKEFHYGGIQGFRSRFTYQHTQEGVEVTDTKTGEIRKATEYKPGRYRVTFEKRHYFQDDAIRAYEQRKKIDEMPIEVRQRRNNVEATVYHFGCLLRLRKSRYRGLYKNQLWATCRAAWVNLTRIRNYLETSQLAPA